MMIASAARAVSLVGLITSLLVTSGVSQVSPPSSVWQQILYPDVPIPRVAGEALTIAVFGGRSDQKPSQLGLSLTWGSVAGVRMPKSIANPKYIVVRLHTSDGKVIAPYSTRGWDGIGGGIGQNGGSGMSWTLSNMFPWSRNALDEAWFEVRVPGQTWWLEVPYGFVRNPDDPEVPDRSRGEPRFPSGMLPIGQKDILVPWLAIEYDIGRIHDRTLLSVKLGNDASAHASVRLYRDQPQMQVSRLTLDSPRVSVSVAADSLTKPAYEVARVLTEGNIRSDDFRYGLNGLSGRTFGTITITIDGFHYGVRVPSSLFLNEHGRTDYENKHWMVVPRLGGPVSLIHGIHIQN